MSGPRRMEAMRIVDFFIQVVPAVIALVFLVFSLYEIQVGGWNSFTAVGFSSIMILIPSTTVILYTSFYLCTFYHLDYLLPHIRVVVSASFTMLGMTFTSLSFSRTLPSLTIYSCMFFIISVILWSYNRNNQFFQFPFSFVWLVIYYGLLRVLVDALSISNEDFLAQGILKFVALWIWGELYKKRGGLENIKRGGNKKSVLGSYNS